MACGDVRRISETLTVSGEVSRLPDGKCLVRVGQLELVGYANFQNLPMPISQSTEILWRVFPTLGTACGYLRHVWRLNVDRAQGDNPECPSMLPVRLVEWVRDMGARGVVCGWNPQWDRPRGLPSRPDTWPTVMPPM